jgi:polyhydroxyalkanoate synthase
MAVSAAAQDFPVDPAAKTAMPEELSKMLLGIQLYQNHAFVPPVLPLEEIWRAGMVTLNAAQGYIYKEGAPAMVLVPSLINKAHILDLMEGRSLLRFLAGQGINAYLLDWGQSTADDAQKTVDDLVTQRLVPALKFLRSRAGGPVHALGYCMGGTLLTAAAVHETPASLVMLAAPWDFHAGSQALLNRVKFWAPSAAPQIAEKGFLPMDWAQVVFASLDPFMAARKFSKFSEMDQESEEARLFVAVEDWLNDGVDLPSAMAQHCIQSWFMENAPGRRGWQVGGKNITPGAIQCSALIVASSQDRLVEYETAAALGSIKDAVILDPACGHIGMIAGREAQQKVWAPIVGFIKGASK